MPEQPPRRVPLGEPLEESDEDLDEAAKITPEDIERAKQAWRRVKDGYENLLDAEPEGE